MPSGKRGLIRGAKKGQSLSANRGRAAGQSEAAKLLAVFDPALIASREYDGDAIRSVISKPLIIGYKVDTKFVIIDGQQTVQSIENKIKTLY